MLENLKKIAQKFFNVKYCLAVSSGTAAIKIALKSLGVGLGDEVITQGFNFIATIEAILDCGAKPIICNINKTLNMDPNHLTSLINKKTKCIIPVHMLGVSAEMNEIIKIAENKKIPILEDNCEAIGAKYKKGYLGSIGNIGVMSFDHGKMITTGEGGMILTNDKNLYKFSREYHDHGHENNPNFPRGKDTKSIPGFNYRMTEIQGAIGKVQLSKLNKMILDNKERYNILQRHLSKSFDLRDVPIESQPSYDTFIFFENDKYKRDKILKILNENKFGSKNLPDAMEWHCSFFWTHALDQKQIKQSVKIKDLLERAIAIPIWLKKDLQEYKKLADLLTNL